MKTKTSTLLIASSLLTIGCLADIRPNDPSGASAQSVTAEQRGRQLLDHAAELQGVSKWKDAGTYEVVGRDHWKGLLGRAGNPWPHADVKVRLEYSYGDFDGRATFLNGKHEGKVWGMQAFETYREVDDERTFKRNEDQAFILAAYHYFFEFPERIRTVPVVRWTGTERLHGGLYDVVYASWSEEPSGAFDQYLVYVNRETGLIEKARYTLRDFASFATGTIHFADFREVNGALFPFRQTVTAKPDDKPEKYLHELTVDRVRIGSFPRASLVVDPTLPNVGNRKL